MINLGNYNTFVAKNVLGYEAPASRDVAASPLLRNIYLLVVNWIEKVNGIFQINTTLILCCIN